MSKTFDEDVAFIRALAGLLNAEDLAEIEVERDFGDDEALKVRITRPAPAAAPAAALPALPAAPAAVVEVAAPAAGPPAAAAADPAAHPGMVPSPMVGTAYLSPEPDSDPFVRVGDAVTEGQTLLIVEAMKTMNQIPSPRAGTVREILVENGQPVEFGLPLMIVD